MLRDRGTIKWTSLMLPEHVELLKEMWQEDANVQKPELDSQEIDIMNQRLSHACHYKIPVRLSIYDAGDIMKVTGHIKQINTYAETIQLGYDINDERIVSFHDVIDVSELDK